LPGSCHSGGRPAARLAAALIAAAAAALTWPAGDAYAQPAPYRVVDGGIPLPLTADTGDPARGRAIVANRHVGLCLLCHSGPIPEERFQGTLAPDLAGAGSRWTAPQLRLRLVDGRQLNPATIMPSYYRTDGLTRVGAAWQGRTLLGAQQIEDVVAYLLTLRAG